MQTTNPSPLKRPRTATGKNAELLHGAILVTPRPDNVVSKPDLILKRRYQDELASLKSRAKDGSECMLNNGTCVWSLLAQHKPSQGVEVRSTLLLTKSALPMIYDGADQLDGLPLDVSVKAWIKSQAERINEIRINPFKLWAFITTRPVCHSFLLFVNTLGEIMNCMSAQRVHKPRFLVMPCRFYDRCLDMDGKKSLVTPTARSANTSCGGKKGLAPTDFVPHEQDTGVQTPSNGEGAHPNTDAARRTLYGAVLSALYKSQVERFWMRQKRWGGGALPHPLPTGNPVDEGHPPSCSEVNVWCECEVQKHRLVPFKPADEDNAATPDLNFFALHGFVFDNDNHSGDCLFWVGAQILQFVRTCIERVGFEHQAVAREGWFAVARKLVGSWGTLDELTSEPPSVEFMRRYCSTFYTVEKYEHWVSMARAELKMDVGPTPSAAAAAAAPTRRVVRGPDLVNLQNSLRRCPTYDHFIAHVRTSQAQYMSHAVNVVKTKAEMAK
jgi:hypothetical protein